jgi:tetratricopeptide (TPR) repeat protein
MKGNRLFFISAGFGILLFGTTASLQGAEAIVKVWEGRMVLPTYDEGLPDVNPPFDLFHGRSFITYPYTTRENLTNQKKDKAWRTLNLENEYLKVTVLPDLGGRLYSCVDKSNGREMFYANPSIKYAQVAFRGAWVALGIEFNFPVSHNWMTVSPVDFGTVKEADGGASIWVGNIDRPYGMMWRVALTLHPGSSLLEQTITLYNASDLRHRFYWWNTASVQVDDDSRIIYPMEFTASHGFKDVDTWPVDSSGLDLSIPANHTRGFVSRFAHATREPFMGIYHPKSQSGVAHYSPIDQAPAKKIWSWGWDADGKDWRRALSDNDSAYLEVQAGLFRNQETYAFLEPQQFLRFKEYWMPIRQIGGFSRVNLSGALNLQRTAAANGKTNLHVGINVTRAIANGLLRIKANEKTVQVDQQKASVLIKGNQKTVQEVPLTMQPSGVFQKTFDGLDSVPPYTAEIIDANGDILLAHTEGIYDWTHRSEVKTGPVPSYRIPPAESRTEGDFLELGKNYELNGKLLEAYETCLDGLRRFPDSVDLNKAAGRLAVQLKRFDEARNQLSKVVVRISNDPEALYYLGNALMFLGEEREARVAWESSALLPSFRAPALLQLARQEARKDQWAKALETVRKVLEDSPRSIKAGCAEVALLRRLANPAEAKRRLDYWLSIDPPNSFLRAESIRQGRNDESLWHHLAGDPERVIEVALDYMRLGFYQEAAELLARRYPSDGVQAEPGTALPHDYPLVSYYRGYCNARTGNSGKEDYQLAQRQSTRYVFPNRPETIAVLRDALSADQSDPTAHYLLGCLYLSGGLAEEAIKEWESARQLNPSMPVLHRNLAYARLHSQDTGRALALFQEGIQADPMNVDNYFGLDQTMSLLSKKPVERVAGLKQYPDFAHMPPALVMKLSLALVESGSFDDAAALWPRRYFPREEFGTNVRQVYLEVLVQKALSLADQGRKEDALQIAASMGEPVPGISFTADGLDAFLKLARFQYYLGVLYDRCGQPDMALKYWQVAAQSREGRQAPFAYQAARSLGDFDAKAWEAWLSQSLLEVEDYIAGGGHFPGAATFSKGMILRLLGREPEGTEQLRQVFYLPDKGMSHYLARRELQK